MSRRSLPTFFASPRIVPAALLLIALAGCGTWQRNGAPAESLASPRVIERDLSGGHTSSSIDRSVRAAR